MLTGRYGDGRSYLVVDGDGNYREFAGYPPPEMIRGEISFSDLPDGARRKVLEVYRKAWNL
ncbi:hypothetical protein [Rubrobacter indicoceani]|uniref:hypothetical protein n=1 Tax=Rubrobacter indicoceani TaxID=2051957 RepID=UPI000E5AE557|nr:hypothetical protein [Rubrobacter indicoceani]